MVLFTIGAALAGLYAAHAVKESAVGYVYQKQIDQLDGGLNVIRDFELILQANGIRRTEFKSLVGGDSTFVLAENSYRKCLNFIYQQALTDESDEQRFIEHYRQIRQKELEVQHQVWNSEYEQFISELELDNDSTFIFEMQICAIDHQRLVDEVYNKTILGDLAVKKGKAIVNNLNGRRHLWVLKGINSRFAAEKLYRICARKVCINIW